MNLKEAVRAAASDAPDSAVDALEAVRGSIAQFGALDNERRVAHLIGQCAHESLRFTRVAESLFYTSTDRLMQIFGRHFTSAAQARGFLRNSKKLANRVYANRNGNGPSRSGDGFRYRGRGYLQLTGRSNYRIAGRRLGIDLVAHPEMAAEPETAWMIAVGYLATRKRDGRTAFQWADDNNFEAVTRIVNGRTNGLDDRRHRTILALSALGSMQARPILRKGDEGDAVELLQRALASRGFSPGAIDGDFGPKTATEVRAFQRFVRIRANGVVNASTWRALEPLPS